MGIYTLEEDIETLLSVAVFAAVPKVAALCVVIG